jgi:hypothetical protein
MDAFPMNSPEDGHPAFSCLAWLYIAFISTSFFCCLVTMDANVGKGFHF